MTGIQRVTYIFTCGYRSGKYMGMCIDKGRHDKLVTHIVYRNIRRNGICLIIWQELLDPVIFDPDSKRLTAIRSAIKYCPALYNIFRHIEVPLLS